MSKYWEIVQLVDGSFALQHPDDGEEPLVRIEFSKEAEAMMQGKTVEVAQAMIGAGVEAATASDFEFDDLVEESGQTIH